MTTDRIKATAVRFIKLGGGGKFEQAALADDRLYLGYHEAADKDCRSGDWEAVRETFIGAGHKAQSSSGRCRRNKTRKL